ncbi:MAG TPA: cupin domain-containing protein [Stellaceae bacterium]|nr:cupin domain-containing protein [Stellaceae bacterium]
MGKIVDFATAERRGLASGASAVPIVDWFDGVEMMASVLVIGPAVRHEATVAVGSDQYLYMLRGEARIECGDSSAALAADDWVLIEEGRTFAVSGDAEILSVVAPPPGSGKKRPGFQGRMRRMRTRELPVVDLPAEKKRRTYLANAEIAGSERGHAMIVAYTGETLTKRHHHPNAESLFVVLTGRVRFLVNGAERVLGRGEAAFFPINDSHALRSGDGNALSFLEFHIPGAFETRYDA